MPRHQTLLLLLCGILWVWVACASDKPQSRPDLPPLAPPADLLFCPMGGEDGIGTAPKPKTDDQLSDAEVRVFMAPRSQDLRECYEHRIRAGYAVEGTVGVRFYVSPQGYVQQLCLVEDSTGDGELISCLFGEIGTWMMPPKPGRTEVRHRMGFKLPR